MVIVILCGFPLPWWSILFLYGTCPGPEETESPGSHAPASLWPVGEPGLGTLVKQMKSSMKFKEAFTLKCEPSMRSHCLPHSWIRGAFTPHSLRVWAVSGSAKGRKSGEAPPELQSNLGSPAPPALEIEMISQCYWSLSCPTSTHGSLTNTHTFISSSFIKGSFEPSESVVISHKDSQFSSVAQSCLTLCDPMDCSTPGFPVHHQLLELAQTHVHKLSDAIQPSHSLLPLLLLPSIFPRSRVFSSESALCIRWPKYWSFSFSFSISPSNEYSELTSFRMDWYDLLEVQGTLKSLLQHYSSKASIRWLSVFFIVQLSHPYMTTGKTIALT